MVYVAQTCFETMSQENFLSIADEYPDLVTHLHTGNVGLIGSVPGLIILKASLLLKITS